MNQDEHRRFTGRLSEGLSRDGRVLGLAALGSMSGEPPLADRYSDHDFFVVTQPGAQEAMRSDLSWLPDAGQLVFSFRETAHGVKALYGSGHLLEFAVFDLQELELARINRFRVLLDRCGLEARMAALRERTAAETAARLPGLGWLSGQLLTALLIGAGRYLRGERLAGRARLHDAARDLAQLFARVLPAAQALDSLDPLRRLEQAFPGPGAELEAALARPPPEAALLILALARRELAPRLPGFPDAAAQAIADFLARAAADSLPPGS